MVITKLYGGLGNQMFQYAAGLSLAARLNTKLYMNLDWFEKVMNVQEATKRVYELDGFGIKAQKMSLLDKIRLRSRPTTIFKEQDLDYHPSFEELSRNIVLDGYWQSYKYFYKYDHKVRTAFTFPVKISSSNKKLLDQITNLQSVSLHIRRGDYVTSAHTNKYHGLIPINYYKQAVADLNRKIREINLFIFSDDIEWTKQNLKFELPTTFVNNGPSRGIEDMRLMSACKHNIIANSSFSWWAAWLNQNDEKIVYAPTQWFKAAKYNLDDRLPREWIKV